jgi:hypothetical protein
MHSSQQALAVQFTEIPPGGHRRDSESPANFRYRDPALGLDQFNNSEVSFCGIHMSLLRGDVRYCLYATKLLFEYQVTYGFITNDICNRLADKFYISLK